MVKNKLTILFLACFLIIFSFSFVSSDKVEIQETKGILITDANPDYIEKGKNHTFDFHLQDLEDGTLITDNSTNCHFDIYGRNGKAIYHTNLSYASDGHDSNWQDEVSGDIFNVTGEYNYIVVCSDDLNKIGGSRSEKIYVTNTGNDVSEAQSYLLIGLLGVMVLFLFASIYGLIIVDDYKGKFALFWVAYLLMIVISFAGWQIGLVGVLGTTALGGIFRIIFWVFIVGLFPAVLSSIALIMYIHVMNDDFRKMMEKGMTPEEAHRRSAKRRYF